MADKHWEEKVGLARMLVGGVIMDVTTADEARLAAGAGAAAVMALERVPADIRRDGGVARMAPLEKIQEIKDAVTIPVMAKARIGHFMEARILEAAKVDYIDESEVLTPADEAYHIEKFSYKVPFVCGARNLGEALRRVGEGAAMNFQEYRVGLFGVESGWLDDPAVNRPLVEGRLVPNLFDVPELPSAQQVFV